ncbi:MAG: small multi-drug export protein [Patescibacteria group bacterium]
MGQEFITVLIAMTPTLEAHGAITTAIGVFHFSAVKAFLLAILGTVAITPLLLIFWNHFVSFLMRRIYLCNRFFTWLFSYTQRKHGKHFAKYEIQEGVETLETKKIDFWKAVALYVFVAVPGPLTGVWGGTVAAFVFGVPFKHSFVALVLGAVTVALIDVFIISGFFQFIS